LSKMSGIGEGIAVELLVKIIIKCVGIGTAIVNNYRHFDSDGKDQKLRLRTEISRLESIQAMFANEESKRKVILRDRQTLEMLVDKVYSILWNFSARFCPIPTGATKTRMLAFGRALAAPASLDAAEEFTKLNTLQSNEGHDPALASLVTFWERVNWSIWKKSAAEKLIVGIGFWGDELDKHTRLTILRMLIDHKPADIDQKIVFPERIGQKRGNQGISNVALVTGAEILKIRTAANPTRSVSLDSLAKDKLRIHGRRITQATSLKTLNNLGGNQCDRGWANLTTETTTQTTTSIVIIEPRSEAPTLESRQDLTILLRTFQTAAQATTFHVLDCEGYSEIDGKLAIIFKPPPSSYPQYTTTLASILSTPESLVDFESNLQNRINFAKALVWTLVELHAVGWVHEAINPDNILFFSPTGDKPVYDWTRPYLVGFQSSRTQSGNSSKGHNPSTWMLRVHAHPVRQRNIYTRFEAIHDIYSLGVVLLEIGGLNMLPDESQYRSLEPDKLRNELVSMAKTKLPSIFGSGYSEAVALCLEGSGVETADNACDAGAKYRRLLSEFVEQVCGRLESIQLY
jgi:hypothetical protein